MSAVNFEMPTGEINELARQKLAAFEGLTHEFGRCFLFVQDMHGQRRFPAIPIDLTVRYLHALWVCELKDRLLCVPKTIQRYEGAKALALMRQWQTGESAGVVRFLQVKLDSLPFADLTQQYEAAYAAGKPVLAERLAHGREVMLNRSFNLSAALDAVFAVDPEALVAQVRDACARHGHSPEEIEAQLDELRSPLCSYAPNATLARRNMLVMMSVGVRLTENPEDAPGDRTERVQEPESPLRPFAEVVIPGERLLSGMADNNPAHLDLAMPPLEVDAPELLRPPTRRDESTETQS